MDKEKQEIKFEVNILPDESTKDVNKIIVDLVKLEDELTRIAREIQKLLDEKDHEIKKLKEENVKSFRKGLYL